MINIYCLVDPRDNKPFYVGATNGKINTRLSGHINEVKAFQGRYRSQKQKFIEQILQSGKRPRIRLLFVATKYNVDYYEQFFYSMFLAHGYTLLQLPSAFHYAKKMEAERNFTDPRHKKQGFTNLCTSVAKININNN